MLNFEEIKNITQDFFRKAGFDVEISGNFNTEQNQVILMAQTQGSGLLIGHSGEILLACQHLLMKVLTKKIGAPLFLDLDINSYKRKKEEFLKDLARNIADQVSLSKKSITFDPMLAYERRIVHTELAHHPDVITVSVGEEPERCVKVEPRPAVKKAIDNDIYNFKI